MEYREYLLHKTSPIFYLGHTVSHLVFPLFMIVLSDMMPLWLKYSMGVLLAYTLFWSLIRFKFYKFFLKEDEIEIKEGVLFKTNRKIPYLRIQNVNINQNPIHRFFEVATLQLESASGGGAEATMRVVEMSLVEEIKEKVRLAHLKNSGALDGEDLVKESKPLVDIETKDVIKYGIISQKGMLYGAIIFGFLIQYEEYVIKVASSLGKMYGVPDFSQITLLEGVLYISISGVILFLFLQTLSVLWSLMKFYKFKIVKEEDRLQATMGLLSKVSATIPLKRIQLYRVSENPLHRYFKAKTIDIETAGGVNSGSGIIMRWLAPYIATSNAEKLIKEVEPKIKIDSIEWQLIPYRAWRRVLIRSLFSLILFIGVLLLISLAPKVEIRYYAWIIIAFMFPMTYVYAKRYIKKTAYFYNEDIICFKSGVWSGKESYVKIDKIQTVEILESPFDRRNKMATLEIDTAGSNQMLHHVRIPYLEVEEAYRIRDFIQDRVRGRELVW